MMIHKYVLLLSIPIILFSLTDMSEKLPPAGKQPITLVSAASSNASDTAIPEDEIKANLKERMEKIVKGEDAETVSAKIKKAIVGQLETIANNTLTIATDSGPKLASISAETTFVRLPQRSQIKVDDLEINSQTIAIGYFNGNQVLNAMRIIVDGQPKKPEDRFSAFIIIDSFSPDSDELSAHNLDNQTYEYEIDKNTLITKGDQSALIKTTADEFLPGSKAVVIFRLEKSKNIILKIHLISRVNESIVPTDLDTEPTQASPSRDKISK